MGSTILKVAVIGCGKISQTRHLPEYDHNDSVKIVGFFDHHKDRAQHLADQYGGRVYDDLDQLLTDPEIDAVSVCVANQEHAAVTIEALKHHKDVLCEKPMATNMHDCLQMVKTAEESGQRLFIDQNQRLAKSHLYAKKIIENGLIGKIITFKSTFGHGGPENWSVEKGPDTWFFNKARSKFGAIFDLGVHKIDLIRFILNDEIKKVTSRSFTLDKRKSDGSFIDVDDNSIGIYEFESGVVGAITSSWTYYGEEDNSTIFYGDKGLLKIYDDPKYSIKAFLLNGDHIDYDIDHIQTNESQTNSGVIDNFVDSLINKKSSVLEAVKILGSMRAVFAGIESNNNNDTENVGN